MAMPLSAFVVAILAMSAWQDTYCVRTRIAIPQSDKANAAPSFGAESGYHLPVSEVMHTNQLVPGSESMTDFSEEEGSLKNRKAAAQDSDLPVGAHALIEVTSVEQSHAYEKGGESGNIARGQWCCCRLERCSLQDIEQGAHEKWKNEITPVCCRFRDTSCPKEESSSEQCKSYKEEEIKKVIERQSDPSCRKELIAFTKQIRHELDLHKNTWLHGTETHAIHPSVAATNINYGLLAGNQQFDRSSTGAYFFRHWKKATMLWNEIKAANRAKWTEDLDAAELSRGQDVAFARAVDHDDVGQLRSCSDIGKFWYIASATFAGVNSEKPLLLVIGKDNEKALRATQFWMGELLGVAENPPEKGVSVVSVGNFQCNDLMPVLTRAIEDKISKDGHKEADLRRKWFHVGRYTCRTAKADEPDHFLFGGRDYPGPGSADDLIEKVKRREMSAHREVWARLAKWDLEELSDRVCPEFEKKPMLPEFSDEDAQELAHHCPKLETIYLSNTKVGDPGVKELAKNCANLREVWLQRTKVTDIGVKEIANHCPNLEDIRLYNTQVTDIGVKELAHHCPNLETIYLSSTKVGDPGVKELVRGRVLSWKSEKGYLQEELHKERMTIEQAKSRCEGLLGCMGFYYTGDRMAKDTEIDITFASSSTVKTSLWSAYTSYLPKDLSNGCPNLREIYLQDTAVTDVGVKELAKNCANLREVWLQRTKVTDIGVKELSAHCTNLEKIVLDGTKVTDVGVKELLEHCKKLQEIVVPSTVDPMIPELKATYPGVNIE